MSLRTIELQLVMPKSQDVGQLQNTLHQRATVEQSVLMTKMKQLEIEKRKKTEKLNKSEMREHNTTKTPRLPRSTDHRGRFIDIEL
ncbi:hypothetical protein BHF71_00525 [Vulcanibacillus modesticaldus]|uniref:Uncharacterized protein n=1 Tax=Vulcanibacillus modesticaldus TaxID=337097 RepID=A0A1D2YXS0_9BACI|nr:hypothetical protein [Vulcanibacillus modesticaldus]OEG00427.1 hypothetical protein BHF71_00525 [Vulcanibacillus modesticaldus]